MKKMNIEPKLEKFLRKEKVLTKFKKNVNLPTDEIVDDISTSFSWSDTPEGHEFWKELDTKFRQE